MASGPGSSGALFRHDLPLTTRWRLGRHIKRCAECGHQVLLFASAHAELSREAQQQTLTGFEAIADWPRLELEMLGNIAVGVSAARCIEKVGHKRVWIVRCSLAAAFSALFVVGWVTHIPGSETHQYNYLGTPPLWNGAAAVCRNDTAEHGRWNRRPDPRCDT